MKFDIPKLILTDIDGVWTDGGMYYDNLGNEFKKFSTYDSAGVLLCKKFNVKVGIITGETTNIVKRRAEKLKIKHLFMGVDNKLTVANNLCRTLNLSLDQVAYIGDDFNDLPLLNSVGISGAPKNAHIQIKSQVDYITKVPGGEGAFREFVEVILRQYKIL